MREANNIRVYLCNLRSGGRFVVRDHDVQTADMATFTRQYVDFIKDRPWYEFNFKSQLKDLWTAASFTGDHLLRKWERRYWLTSELLVKTVYGKLIGLGTSQVYEKAIPTAAVVLQNDSFLTIEGGSRRFP